MNLNLVRNHILYSKGKIEEILSDGNYPEIYYREIPPEVDQNHMARADEIRVGARKSLEIYKADSHYQYSKLHASELTAKEMKKHPVTNVLGYVSGLEDYIEKDDLVSMRRHEDANRYLDSFERCENAIKKILAERTQESQLNLFSAGAPQADVIFHESEDESESDALEITM